MNSVTITIEEAAELLNVSETVVERLISVGTLSLRQGKLSRAHVSKYRATRNRERESALQEMVTLGEDHDLPY